MKPKSNPFLSRLALVGVSFALGTSAKADVFDVNSTVAGFGVSDGSTYDWLDATGFWSDGNTAANDAGTAATVTWQGTASTNEQAYFIGSGTAGENYTVRLGATGATDVFIQNLAINMLSNGSGAAPGAAGNVTIGNTGDAGNLILRDANSVGAQNGGTLTINNGVNLNTRTLNFRGGDVVINGVVSGSGTSKITTGGTVFGFSGTGPGTLTLANTDNTYTGRANSDYLNNGFTLAVTKLANGGSSSSIGTSSANIGINGGMLKYIGNTGAQSTNLGLHIGSLGAFMSADGVTSSDTITITGTPTYSAANAVRTVILTGQNEGDNSMAFTFNNNGSGANVLTKTGAGKWIVNQSNGYTGGTNANGGTLVAANAGAFGVAGRTISFSTGTVEFATDTTANAYVLNLGSGNTGSIVVNRASSAADMTHTMGTATLGNGTLNIAKGANVTGTGTLEFGGITLTAGVTGLSTGMMLNPTTANVLVNGNITRVGSQANLLTLDGTSSGNLISGIISGSQALTKSNSSNWELSNANTFTGKTLVTGGTLVLTNNLAIQSSAFDTSGAGTLDTSTINTPTFGGLTSATDYALSSNVTSLTLNPSSGTQTYSGNLSGGAAGMTLTKTGAGTQILGGTSSYTGLTTVNGGELRVSTVGAIGGTDVTVTSGQLTMDGGITVSGKSLTTSGSGTNFIGGLQSISGTNEWAGSVLLGADNSRMGARRNATLVVSGAIGDGAETFNLVVRNENQNNTSGGGNATTVTELSGVSTYGGNTQVIAGVTRLGGGDNRLPTGTILQFGGSGANAKFDMNGRNQEVAGLAVMSTGNDTQRDWNANELTNSSGTLSTLTVNTAADQTFGLTPTTFSGSGNYSGTITGNIALQKTGSASLTLTAANTYSGATTINGGTLALGAAGSINSSSGVALGGGTFDVSAKSGGYTVNNLTGNGNVLGSITVSTELAIGASPGTVTFGNDLTLGDLSVFNYEFTGGDITADLGIVSGNLTLIDGATLNLFQLGTYTLNETFTLFAYSNALAGTFDGLTEGATTTDNLGGLWRINYGESTAGANFSSDPSGLSFVNITAIPEPSAAALAALSLLALLRRRRA